MMGRGLQPNQPSGWEGEVPGAACVPFSLYFPLPRTVAYICLLPNLSTTYICKFNSSYAAAYFSILFN